jgi:eukaryotic-like serine/threonine-protein kinase
VESVWAGTRLAGRYRLAERIGVGGMAEVWRGQDEVLARSVAVKLIDHALLADEAFRRRFRAEAQAAAGLSHPNVVTVHDYGEEDGTPYIVMELLGGETLADRLSAGPLGLETAAAVCGQTAAALAAAHDAGLVHRDVKPANVFLTRGGGVKVLDFGVAVRGETGPAFGTPAYLAPEQLTNGPVTAAADVFALGVVLFETLTGRRPYGEDDERTRPPRFPPDTPAAIASLGTRCLAADPTARPTSAEVAAALAEPAGDLSVAASTDPSTDTDPSIEPTAELPADQAADQSADVPAEPPADPLPAAPGDHPDAAGPRPATSVLADPTEPRRRRLLTGGGIAAAVALAVAFVLATRGGDHPGATAAPPSPAPSVAGAPPVTPSPSLSPVATTTAGALEALAKMRHSIEEGAAAGQVRSDVALDFNNLISQLQDKLSTGQPVDDLAGRVGQLRVKIEQRLREGGLTAARAQDLRAALSGIS